MEFLDAFFGITLMGVVATLMFSTGLLAEPKEVISYLHGKRLLLTSRVIVVNIVIIPLVAFLLVMYFPLDSAAALVLFLLAIAPAAPLIPPMVHANKGDMNWSLSLLFLLTVISLLTIPFMIHLGATFLSGRITLNPVSSSAFLTNYVIPVFIPLVIGIAIKCYSNDLAIKFTPISGKLVKISNLCLMILVVLINFEKLIHMPVLSTFMLIIFIGVFTLLGAASIYPIADKPQYITASITTGLRNFAIVLLLIDVLTDDRSVLLLIIPVSLAPILVCGLTGWQASKSQNANSV